MAKRIAEGTRGTMAMTIDYHYCVHFACFEVLLRHAYDDGIRGCGSVYKGGDGAFSLGSYDVSQPDDDATPRSMLLHSD